MPSAAAFVTTCSARHAPDALALAGMFLVHHPGAAATVVVVDAVAGLEQLESAGVEVLAGSEIAEDDLPVLAAALEPEELARALGPWALALARAPAVWMSGDALVLGPIEVPARNEPLLVRADECGPWSNVDERFALLNGPADAVLATWREEVMALAERPPLATVMARSGDVGLVRRDADGLAAGNPDGVPVESRDGAMSTQDGTPVAWVRPEGCAVPDRLASAGEHGEAEASGVAPARRWLRHGPRRRADGPRAAPALRARASGGSTPQRPVRRPGLGAVQLLAARARP